jgi:chromosome segregation ATPase
MPRSAASRSAVDPEVARIRRLDRNIERIDECIADAKLVVEDIRERLAQMDQRVATVRATQKEISDRRFAEINHILGGHQVRHEEAAGGFSSKGNEGGVC